MAVIAELTGKKGISSFLKFAAKNVNEKFNLFNPFGEHKGEFNKKWNLRMNLKRRKNKANVSN